MSWEAIRKEPNIEYLLEADKLEKIRNKIEMDDNKMNIRIVRYRSKINKGKISKEKEKEMVRNNVGNEVKRR